ncbi:breast cancer type 1 susceptibility protein homolog isoform X3 [Octopus sinensis]|uniref:RING-type E3 ubiquitin transferase BRCA1 n=1 Tax=Octopus sinensis TaxID=2607531 RepID=A0A7E6F3K9_9MOLL|nr:breast cancer type 1 susceptibility protein homolog isoform X3 [Octopus sinensis]
MSQQKIQKILNSMKKNMDCPICLDLMTNPVSTTCNHHFCKFCINEFIHKKRKVPCPMCNVALTKSFQENGKLKNIIEKLKNLMSAVAKDTHTLTKCREDTSLPNRSLVVKKGIKRKVHFNHKSEVRDVTKIENTQLNGEKLAKVKGHELYKSLKNYSRENDIHKNRKRILEWLQQLPLFFNDWNEDNFAVENSNCKEFQPADNNMKRMPTQCISNFPLKENVCAHYDLISVSEPYSIHSEVVNSDCIYSKKCLRKEQNTFLSATASKSIRDVTKRTLNPKKQSTSYERLQQQILKSIEKFKKFRAKRERNVSSSVNITPKNYVIDLTSLKSVPLQHAYTTDAFSKKRKSNKILGTEKFLMNLSEDKSKNQENKSKVWEDSKLPYIESIQTTSKQNLYKMKKKDEKKDGTDGLKSCSGIKECEPADLEIQSEDVSKPSSFLHASDRKDSGSDLSPSNRLASETSCCSSIKSASQFKDDSLMSSAVDMLISDKLDKVNDSTFHKDTDKYSKPLHNSMKELTETGNSSIVDDSILPCNLSNLSASNKQISTEEVYNDAAKEIISSKQALKMPNKTSKSQAVSNDSKSPSNFLLIPDFKLVDYTLTQSSVMSEDNIKLNSCIGQPQIKESISSQDLERNNEKQLNTGKNIEDDSVSLPSNHSLCVRETCKENVGDISQNMLLEGTFHDKIIRQFNCKSDENLKNSNSLSTDSSPLFSSNSKVDNKEIYENPESLQDVVLMYDKELTPPLIMNSSQDKNCKIIVSEFDPEAKSTIPKTISEKTSDLESQGSLPSMQPCKIESIECQPSSCSEIPCSVDVENNYVNILPELQKLYQNETPKAERKETPEENVVFNNESCSKNLPVQSKYQKDIPQKDQSTTTPKTMMFTTDCSTLDSQIVKPTRASKRKCFSLDGRSLKSVVSDKVFSCQSEIYSSSKKDNLVDSFRSKAKSKGNCIFLGSSSSQPVEEKEKQILENLSDHVISLQGKSSPLKVQKCPRKRRKSNEENYFEIKCDDLKNSASIGNQSQERVIPNEITEEKSVDSSNVRDSYNDSLTQAPSCDRESLEFLTDKTISPMPLSPTPSSITTDVVSEPIVTSWTHGAVPLDSDGMNNLKRNTSTESKEIQIFQDIDIENSNPLLPVDNGIEIEQSGRIQNFSLNLENSNSVANISQESQEPKAKQTLITVRKDSTKIHSEMSQTTANEPKEGISTIKFQHIDTLKTSHSIEMESQGNLSGVQKEGGLQVETIKHGNTAVDISSQLDVPNDVNLSFQMNASQDPCDSSNTTEVTRRIKLSNEKTELQKDTNSFDNERTQSSKQANANKISSTQEECISDSEKIDDLDLFRKDKEKFEGIDNEIGTDKRSKRLVISESEAEQSDEGESLNTSNKNTRGSENVGSQTEKYTTQFCTYLENDLVEMKRQIALLEAKLGMDDSTINEDTDCRDELKLTPCPEAEIPTPDGNLIKTMDCDNKYMRLSSDEDVIPDSFPEEPTTDVEKCLTFDDSKKSATEDSEELFFSPSFQGSSSAACYPKVQNRKKRSQHDNRNRSRNKVKCKKNVPIIESDESDTSVVLADEDGNGSVDKEEVIPSDITGKQLPENKSHKHLNKSKNSIKCEPSHNSSNPFKSFVNIDFDQKEEEVQFDMQSTNRLKQIKYLVATGLSNVDVHKLKQFCDKVGYKFSSQFSSEVTHVIVKTVSPQVRYCDRTLKYFQGIAHKCWVVSFQWIEQSMKSEIPLKEANFEITGDTVNGKHHRGPTRSRLSNTNLLTSYQIYFTGETSELPLEVLENLVKTLGGKLVTNSNCFDLKSKKTCLIISSGNQESHKLAKNVHKKKGVLLLSREWLLDSLAMYEIQSLDGYILL